MPGINKRGALTMAKDHTVLGLQLLISSSSCSPKWCVRTSVLDLLGGALLMELPFFPFNWFGYELDNAPKTETFASEAK